jgi:hypothetical protein
MIDFPASPTPEQVFIAPNGTSYVYRNGAWMTDATLGGIPEAPVDGEIYGRRDEAWEPISADGFPDVPLDGKTYGRKNAAWVELIAAYDLYFDFGSTTVPANAERAVVLTRGIIIPAALTDSKVKIDAGDASAPVFALVSGITTIATLTLSASGGTWANSTPGVDITIAAGALVKLKAPASVSASFLGVRASIAARRS